MNNEGGSDMTKEVTGNKLYKRRWCRSPGAIAMAVFLSFALALGLAACGGGEGASGQDGGQEPADEPETEAAAALAEEYAAYADAIDTQYAYDLAVAITEGDETNSNEFFGDRQSGSDAEHATAELLLSEMEAIGLVEIDKIGVPVDKWQFNGASMTLEGDDTEIMLHSYATAATPAGGIDAEVVYVGKGTEADYAEIDAVGKIVLFDVDQRADWWVTYPMLEAAHQGAAAALACSSSGFSEISDEAYNANDICGPTSIPTVSITVKDSLRIQEQLEGGAAMAHLEVDNIVEAGGTTYNLVGKIKGKHSEQAVMYGAHYDAHFRGFQDDAIAAASVLGIAKAVIDSGVQPERDIWFVLHGAEEWGATNTVYDWCTGAWRLINEAHPEWQSQLLAFINFELNAYEFADYTYSATAPELYSMMASFTESEDKPSPKPEGVFEEGILLDGYQTYTYSDDFSYYEAGVPCVINGFLLTADGDDVFPFYYEYYHTNFDTKDTYDEDVLRFSMAYYGALGLHITGTPALELDYAAQAERLADALDEELGEAQGVDVSGYADAVAAYGEAAGEAWESVSAVNERYARARADGAGQDELDAIFAEGAALNVQNLQIFKDTQAGLLSLVYETPVVPHEGPQENISLINETVAYLNEGDVVSAVDESAWQINGVNEWYVMYFSKEVTDYSREMFIGDYNADNLFWGAGRQFGWAMVDDAVRGITAKYEEEAADFSTEIAAFEAAAADQATLFKQLVDKEIVDIRALTDALNALAA
jgi:Iap family predicted aminopeptidase